MISKNYNYTFALKNIESQLKIMHHRVLEHTGLKHFLERSEVVNYLKQTNMIYTDNKKLLKCKQELRRKLLIINDSLMQFERAVSTGEISLYLNNSNPLQPHGKNSLSPDSTFGEVPSLSSVELTNRNFGTLLNDCSIARDHSSDLPISELELTNRNFSSCNNMNAMEIAETQLHNGYDAYSKNEDLFNINCTNINSNNSKGNHLDHYKFNIPSENSTINDSILMKKPNADIKTVRKKQYVCNNNKGKPQLSKINRNGKAKSKKNPFSNITSNSKNYTSFNSSDLQTKSSFNVNDISFTSETPVQRPAENSLSRDNYKISEDISLNNLNNEAHFLHNTISKFNSDETIFNLSCSQDSENKFGSTNQYNSQKDDISKTQYGKVLSIEDAPFTYEQICNDVQQSVKIKPQHCTPQNQNIHSFSQEDIISQTQPNEIVLRNNQNHNLFCQQDQRALKYITTQNTNKTSDTEKDNQIMNKPNNVCSQKDIIDETQYSFNTNTENHVQNVVNYQNYSIKTQKCESENSTISLENEKKHNNIKIEMCESSIPNKKPRLIRKNTAKVLTNNDDNQTSLTEQSKSFYTTNNGRVMQIVENKVKLNTKYCSSTICEETVNQNHNQDESEFTFKLYSKLNNSEQTIHSEPLLRMNCSLKENNYLNVSEETIMSQDILQTESSLVSSKELEKISPSSTNIVIINGDIISENTIDKTSINSNIENDQIDFSFNIKEIDRDELNKQINMAAKECSDVWNTLKDLLNEAKHNITDASSIPSENITNTLLFPADYQDCYSALENIFRETKLKYSIKPKTNEDEQEEMFFEEKNNKLKEFQNIALSLKNNRTVENDNAEDELEKSFQKMNVSLYEQ